MIISNIKKIMKDKKIKIRDLSSTGLSSATLAKARTDDGILECRLSTLIRIADALDYTHTGVVGNLAVAV